MKKSQNTTDSKESTFTAVQNGKRNYMHRAWYKIFIDGKPLMELGQHTEIHALSEQHAIDICKQIYKSK